MVLGICVVCGFNLKKYILVCFHVFVVFITTFFFTVIIIVYLFVAVILLITILIYTLYDLDHFYNNVHLRLHRNYYNHHCFIMAMMTIASLSTLIDRCLHLNRYLDIISVIVFVTFIVNRHIHVLQ